MRDESDVLPTALSVSFYYFYSSLILLLFGGEKGGGVCSLYVSFFRLLLY